MIYKFHPEARFELESAVEYYESQQAKVGLEFLEEIYSSIQRIINFQDAFPEISISLQNNFNSLCQRHPFGIISLFHIMMAIPKKRETYLLFMKLHFLFRLE